VRIKLIADVGVQGFLVGGNGKIINLAKEKNVFITNGSAVEAGRMDGGSKTVLAKDGINVF
jgi:hypothetical protein